MQLFYAPDLEPPVHTLDEEESRHCIRVLRLGRGDWIHLTDGRGNLYRAEIIEADPRRCTVRVVETQSEFERMPYRLVMAVAPTKNPDRFEWFLEKATEVGADTPESVKIAARIALENERNSILEIEESKRTEKMKARLVAIGKVLETGVTLASLFK